MYVGWYAKSYSVLYTSNEYVTYVTGSMKTLHLFILLPTATATSQVNSPQTSGTYSAPLRSSSRGFSECLCKVLESGALSLAAPSVNLIAAMRIILEELHGGSQDFCGLTKTG